MAQSRKVSDLLPGNAVSNSNEPAGQGTRSSAGGYPWDTPRTGAPTTSPLMAERRTAAAPRATAKLRPLLRFASFYSISDRSVRAVIDPLAQVLSRLEMRHVLAGQRHRFSGFRIPALPRRPEVQRERAEAQYLDAISRRQGIANDLQDLLERELHILGWQMFLFRRDDLDELGLRHGP